MNRLGAEQKADSHRRAAEHLKLCSPSQTSEIAYHLDEAGDPEAALEFALKAAEQARSHEENLRLARARALLETTTLSVRQVMTLVGCTDGSHFARNYRRRYGVTPRQAQCQHRSSTHPGPPKLTPSRHRKADQILRP
jgi:AraC-like DNA-binding protein